MNTMNNRLLTSAFALLLVGLTGCGDGSVDNGNSGAPSPDASVDLAEALNLSDEEASALTGTWKRESDLPYTTFLQIDADRKNGFWCNNDGKSASGPVTFVEVDGQIGVLGPSEFDDGGFEGISYEDGTLVLVSTEKGTELTHEFKKIDALPAICERLEQGEEPTFEEFQASWDE